MNDRPGYVTEQVNIDENHERGAGEAIHPSIDKDADRRMDENAIEEREKE